MVTCKERLINLKLKLVATTVVKPPVSQMGTLTDARTGEPAHPPGRPGPGRSHFVTADTWVSKRTRSDTFSSDCLLGRILEESGPSRAS